VIHLVFSLFLAWPAACHDFLHNTAIFAIITYDHKSV
jgi:hypothetical protein